MLLVVKSGGPRALKEWQDLFGQYHPELEVVEWDDPKADQADYALVWEPDAGRFSQMPNLKIVMSAGAGVDHILTDTAYPRHVPMARMVPQETATIMSEFVLTMTMMLLTDVQAIITAQAQKKWLRLPAARGIGQTRIGVMGMGRMGAATAALLQATGFEVAGWSNRPSDVAGVASYAGPEALDAFLRRSDILVCLLPQTAATQGILCERTFSTLPAGASLINVGRGPHMVEADVIAALDSGQLHRAVLDVFNVEPLPETSALWSHPGVIVTPHCAATPSRADRVRYASMLIETERRGEPLPHLYDWDRGY